MVRAGLVLTIPAAGVVGVVAPLPAGAASGSVHGVEKLDMAGRQWGTCTLGTIDMQTGAIHSTWYYDTNRYRVTSTTSDLRGTSEQTGDTYAFKSAGKTQYNGKVSDLQRINFGISQYSYRDLNTGASGSFKYVYRYHMVNGKIVQDYTRGESGC